MKTIQKLERGNKMIDKSYLMEYSKMAERLEIAEERLKMIDPAGISSGLGGNGNTFGYDKVSSKVAIAVDLRKEVEELRRRLKKRRDEIDRVLKKLPLMERCILELRYIDRQPWKVIVTIISHQKKHDIQENQIYKLHKKALRDICKADISKKGK